MDKLYITYYFLIIVLILKFLKSSENFSSGDFDENYLVKKFNGDIESFRNLSNISKDIYSDGKLIIHGGLDIKKRLNILPKGIIVAWNKKEIPEGWAICDGKNGTPNLIKRFLLGKSSETSLKNTGGEENVKLTLNEIPSHSHSNNITNYPGHIHTLTTDQQTFNYSSYTRNFCSPSDGNYACTGGRRVTSFDITSRATIYKLSSLNSDTDGGHFHTVTTKNTGGSRSHNNMPPYYVLIWIMKL